MRAVVQRVSRAAVSAEGQMLGSIEKGLLVLLAVHQEDETADAEWLAEKIAGLRIFDDGQGRMNLDLSEVGGAMLVVSQFTLYGDARKGKRPSFIAAARPENADPLYHVFVDAVRALGIPVATGQFAAAMQVELVNDGPVTLIVDSPQRKPGRSLDRPGAAEVS